MPFGFSQLILRQDINHGIHFRGALRPRGGRPMFGGLPDGPASANVGGSNSALDSWPSDGEQFVCYESTGNGVRHQEEEKEWEKVGAESAAQGEACQHLN